MNPLIILNFFEGAQGAQHSHWRSGVSTFHGASAVSRLATCWDQRRADDPNDLGNCNGEASDPLADSPDDTTPVHSWTAREPFGLHPVPERPAPTFRRLSRYDSTGLIWLLQGPPVIALTETEAAIQGAGGVVVYRTERKDILTSDDR
jgi:hypothetical protein